MDWTHYLSWQLRERRAAGYFKRQINFYAILLLYCCCFASCQQPNDRSSLPDNGFQEFSVGVGEKALFPNIFNLATHAEIRATSTCGQNGAEYYCKLVEHVFLRQPQCDVCDANDHSRQHPIDYAIDGTRRWWQSPSLGNGLIYEQVNITIDLRQEYQVAYVVLKSGISPRPGTWALEKSLDGVDFTPWQYFAISDAECMRSFGVPATVGLPRFTRDDEVICTSYYSKLNPLDYGEIHTSLVNARPGSNHTSVELQNFTRTRFVRLRLLGLRTLHADLMVINRRDGKLDQSVTRRYFYSISDISIGGQCICYGHAERCPPEETHGQFRCECRHNTYGESCSQCLPLFNQLPWKPGTHTHPNICQECQCFKHAERCIYDPEVEQHRSSVTPEGIYEGGGRCVDCQHNTVGINCEKCQLEFYRPANISHYRSDACRPCDCDAIGAESNNCIRDETEAHDDLRPGNCICKLGFGGRRCDRCALGYRNYPVCEPCPCNRAGSLNFETCEEERCSCKANVEGEYCDRCKQGTLYLDAANPLGCQECFCFGVPNATCQESQWTINNVYPHSIGWNLTDLYDRVEAPLKTTINAEEPVIFNADDYKEYSGDNELIYWKVPMSGNWLNSYGLNVYYYVYFVPNEKYGSAVNENSVTLAAADFVIEGNNARLEYYTQLNFFPRENISVSVPLRVVSQWYDARSRRPVDRADLMRVLANVENVFVRVKYYHTQLQSSIYGIRRESAVSAEESNSAPTSSNKILPVEVCSCPPHYVGNSCERCEVGYRRVGNQLYDGKCQLCQCQGHSQQCDPFTGHCINCQHNTTGARCEMCVLGHYGNPSLGGELGACKPCACPILERSHSSQCALSQLVFEGAAAAEQDAYVCTACEVGYDGNKCEICADGYYGDPFNVTVGCKPCDCSGNVDGAAIGNCDRETGACLRCVGNTIGDHCERCAENHWGNALDHSCQPCGCHHLGALALQCNNNTGACECRNGFRGPQCDRCAPGHGDADSGCPACKCDQFGATGDACDEQSGQCMCKNGVYGKHCDKCIPSYFNFTIAGCQFCHCDSFGALPGKECHNVTGECQCQPNVVGVSCEQCALGFFNISSGQGCQECKCDSVGASDESCDTVTGQCLCKTGVTGLKCDECEPDHWGLSAEGCKRCKVCTAVGQVCDRQTGECLCPPNTVGEMCENCAPNAWNHDPYRGCELCDCDGVGADGTECNARTGQCKCKSSYVGHKCDHCEAGFFNFPDCKPCNCNVVGTERDQCRTATCLCANDGQCKCKKHVTGLKCDECLPHSFSLEAQNPAGCTECFCFNRTSDCVQGDFVWRQIYSPDRFVTFEKPFEYYTRRHNVHILRDAPPLNYNSYPTNHTPLYWPLPKTFLGDRISSYNGWIRFRIRNDANYRGQANARPDSSTYRLFPQVLLIGNHRIELEYVPTSEAPYDGKYKIHLHETVWRNRISPQLPLSRKQFMVALQNVQAVYVRASYNNVYRGDSISISELSVDVASRNDASPLSESNNGVDDDGRGGGALNLAYGVEHCENCPEGYTGSSCQNPAQGYCRKRDPEYLNNADDLALTGWSAPCACNGHSSNCDPENCRCKDCEHNTIGDFCELCKAGYYGNVVNGDEHACHKCACPHADNSFSETCRSTSGGRGYICDACRPGYVGHYCESCAAGYYGNPTAKNGFCALCACHADGSVHDVCHNVTGQCECRNGVTGRDCSMCSARHAFMNGACASCDRSCHKELMKMEDEMDYALGGLQHVAELKPIPRKRLSRISATAASLNEIINNAKSSKRDAAELLSEHADGNRYAKQASVVVQEFYLLGERNNESLRNLEALVADLNEIRSLVHGQNHRVLLISEQLTELTKRVDGGRETQYSLTNAEQYFNTTSTRSNLIEKSLNYAKKNAENAEKLLEEILSKKLDDSEYKQLRDKYERINIVIKDYRNLLWDHSNADAVNAKQIALAAGERLAALREIVGEIEALNRNAANSLNAGSNATKAISNATVIVRRIYTELENSLFTDLKAQQDRLIELSDIYSVDSRAHDAQRHAVDLERQAQGLKNTFDLIQSSNAFVASNAYKEIAVSMKDATNALAKAKENAESSFSLLDISSDASLANSAVNSKNKSLALEDELEKRLKELGITEYNNRLKAVLNRLSQLENEASQNVSWIKDVQQLLDDHHDRINTVHSTIDEAHDGLGEVEASTRDFASKVAEVKKRADTIQSFNQQSIQEHINNVTENTAKIAYMAESLSEVKTRTDRHLDQIGSIRQDLYILKEKINEAREKASKIRIAVKSDVGDNCVREYISPMNPTVSNAITIKYRPAIDSPDSLIFLAITKGTRSQSREYIAVELKGKKFYVKWDIGGGRKEAAIIKRNIIYIPASDRYTWYQIEVKRVANTIQLGVVQKQVLTGEREKNVDEPTHVSVGELNANADAIFNTVPGQTRIYIGHVEDAALVDELQLATNRFHGTMGELNVDGVNVPLWVFDKSTGSCDGATGSQSYPASGHMFRNGFAQVRLPMNDRTSSLIIVQFSAYSPSGLLYFRASPTSGEFIAISLRDGSVEFKAKYGGGNAPQNGSGPQDGIEDLFHVSVRSTKFNYADGHVHKVRIIRNKGEVHLQVDEDDHVSTALVSNEAVIEIAEPDHFVGGIPPNFNRTIFDGNDIQFNGFFGCIQQVKPNQVSELDLHFPYRSQHKELGCMYREERLNTMDSVIGFSNVDGNGCFVRIKGVELSASAPYSTFSFNFRSRRANALLIHQFANNQQAFGDDEAKRLTPRDNSGSQGYFGFYLHNGRLIAQVGVGHDQISLNSSNSYDDGLLHSVFLSRSGAQIHVRIDDREQLEAALDNETPIGAAATRSFMLLGGLPPSANSEDVKYQNVVTAEHLIGCISDLQYNYERLPLALEEHSGVTLGTCEETYGRHNKLVSTQDGENGASKWLEDGGGAGGDSAAAAAATHNFERKKSPQSFEPVIPTVSISSPSTSISTTINADHMNTRKLANEAEENEDVEMNGMMNIKMAEEEEEEEKEDDKLSSIGRSRRKEDLCDTWLLEAGSNATNASEATNGVRFGVSETSHARVNFVNKPYPDYTNFNLSFSFRTAQKNALLWAWASYKNYTRYFHLNLERGFLVLVIKGHREPKRLYYNARAFNDAQWHTVELVKLNHELSLQVDDYAAGFLYDAPNPKVMRKRMYVGGVISKHRKLFDKKAAAAVGDDDAKMLPGLVGCVRDFRVNGETKSLLAASRDLIPCTTSRGISYIHHGGFAIFEPLRSYGKLRSVNGSELDDVEVGIQFRLAVPTPKPPTNNSKKDKKNNKKRQYSSDSDDDDESAINRKDTAATSMIFGLFASAENGYQSDRILLRIENTSLLFSAHFERHRVHVEERLSLGGGVAICTGRWHRLTIRLSARAASVVNFNGEHLKLTELRVTPTLLDEVRALPVHIGGTMAPISVALNLRSMHGCVKELEFSGLIVSMDNAKKLHKIVEDGCPY